MTSEPASGVVRRARLRAQRAVGLAVAAAALALVGAAGPAAAHATLLGSDPAPGAVLGSAPERVTLTFDEDVAAVPDGVQVLDARGDVVASAASVAGPRLEVDLTGPVGDGTLVVVWRVVSADGHPLGGALTFSVGEPSATGPAAATDAGPTRAPPVLGAARAAGYLGLLLTSGLVAFVVGPLGARGGTERARRRVVVTARAGAGLATAGWLVALPLTGAYQLGRSPSLGGAAWAALSATQVAVASVVVVALVVAVGCLGDGVPGRRRGAAAAVAAAVATGAPAATGHTRAAEPQVLAVAVDVVHLAAGAVWLGGLVGLLLVLTAPPARRGAAAEVLARFSALAAGVLALLVASGGVLAWRVAGSWEPLVGGAYGRVLLVKVAIVAVAVGVAGWNRVVLVPRAAGAGQGDRGREGGRRVVGRSVAVEAALLVAVVVVTGVLVDTSPQEPATATASVEARSTELGDVVVLADLAPGVPGPTTLTVRLEHPDGGPAQDVESLSARLASDAVDLGDVPLAFVGPGVFEAAVVVPAPGTWHLQVSVRRGEFDNPVTTLELDVA